MGWSVVAGVSALAADVAVGGVGTGVVAANAVLATDVTQPALLATARAGTSTTEAVFATKPTPAADLREWVEAITPQWEPAT